MKFFVVVSALVAVACAEAEADAALLYTSAYSPLTYGAHAYGAFPYSYGVSPYTFGAYRHFGKRSADAEPEADAALLYTSAYSPLTYGAHAYGAFPYSYGVSPYTFGAYRHFGKRSADAEPEADAALLYTSAYSPLTYGAHAFGAFPYSYGVSPYTYGAYRHFGKRSADADPALLYSGAAVYSPYSAYHPYAYAAGHHAVAATPFGLTHSSNVGLCFNNAGARVSC